MQTIVTKSFPPTSKTDRKVKASCEAGSVTLPWCYARDNESNHNFAVLCLTKMLDWSVQLVCGALPQNEKHEYVYVILNRKIGTTSIIRGD